jgi:hypothetical protein
MTVTFDRVLSGLAGLFLGLGGSLLTNRIALSGFDRLYMFLFVLGIALLPVSFYVALVRRIAALEGAAKRTPHATDATAASATAR